MIFKTIDDETTISGQKIVGALQARKIVQQQAIKQTNLDIQCLRNYENACKNGAVSSADFTRIMGKASTQAQEYSKNIKEGTGSAQVYADKQKTLQQSIQNTGTASRVAAVGVKALSIAGNMLAGMAIAFAISKVIEGIEYLATASERAIEKTKELQQEISQISSDYQSERQILEGLREEYDALTSKIGENGAEASLSADEYERYRDITSEILGITPKLITGWDEEGRAISNKNGLLQQSIDLLDEEYQKSLRNSTTKSKNEEIATGIIEQKKKFDNSGDTKTISGTKYNLVWRDLKDYVNKAVASKKVSYIYENTGAVGINVADAAYAINEFVYGDNLYKATELNTAYGWLGSLQERITSSQENFEKFANSLSNEDNPVYQWFTDEQIDELIRDVDEYFQELARIEAEEQQYFQQYKDQLNLNAQAVGDAYSSLDEQTKAGITQMIDSFDYNDMTKEKFSDMATDLKDFVGKLSTDDTLLSHFNNLFKPMGKDESIEDYESRVKTGIDKITSYCESNYPAIKLNFGDVEKDVEDLKLKYNTAISKFTGDANDVNLTKFFNDNSINTTEEIEYWNKVIDGAQSATEAVEMYNKVKSETFNNETDISTLFTKINDSLKSLTDNASLLSSVNKEISETGRISADNLEKINEAFPEDKYPEMTKALYEYQLGLISEQDLFTQLEKCYEQNANDYKQLLIKNLENDNEFFEKVKINNVTLFSSLADDYKLDVKNWTSLAKAKANIDTNLMKELSGIWQGYYTVQKDAITGLYTLTSNYSGDDSFEISPEEEADRVKQLEVYEKYNKIIKSINDAFSSIDIPSFDLDWESLSGDSASSASDTAKSYDLIERAISRLERKLSSLKNVTDDTFASWSDRNKALIDQISTISEQIELQDKAHDKYMQLANATGLSDYYKDLIQNGAIDEITISDQGLQEQIDAYQDYYDKAMDASDTVKELQSSLNELEKSKMDIISTQFEEITDSISHAVNMLNSYIDLADAKNYFATESIYQKLAEYQDKNTSVLYSERDKLNEQFATLIANGTIKEGSEEFNNMQQEINSVNEAIIESVIETRKWVNEIQNLDFEKFDWVQEKISGLTSEADFFIDLIEGMEKDLYSDNGKYTNEGITVAGLHAQNLNTYLQQADDYANKIKEINELIANDSANKSLIEQKEEYIKAQREAIISAQEERKAIIDLVKDGFDKQIESLSDIIDKYKDLMSINKDAYDYEKSMAEKSATLASLQKQYMAWQGDNSESGMKNRQELENQIKDTKDDIAESQYDKMISDAERLLDDLEAEYENMVNESVDRICGELDNITQHINESSDTISNVLTKLSADTKLPLTEAMMSIWNDGKPVADINSTVANVGSAISGTNTAIEGVKDKLQEILNKMNADLNGEISNVDDGSYNSDNNTDYSTNHTPYEPSEPSYETGSSNSSNSSDNTTNFNDSNDGWAIYKKYFAQPLNTQTSVVDRLKSNDIDASFEARSIYWDKLIGEGQYTSSYDQNVKLLNWLKSNGYANGTHSAIKGLHLTDEKGLGSEVILTKYGALRQLDSGDHVFNDKMTENLWKLAQADPSRFIPNLNLNTKLPEMVNRNISNDVKIEFGDINVKANNPQEFGEQLNRELAKNQKTIKILQEQTIGQIMGHNSLSARSYL